MVTILPAHDFYAQISAYMQRLDPSWDFGDWRLHVKAEQATLAAVLGPAEGRSVLDASCGSGRQTLALASLGWQVTAADYVPTSLMLARDRAQQLGLVVAFHTADMRSLSASVPGSFDWVVSCMALDNLLQDEELEAVIAELWRVLSPHGRCYIRLRDFDNLMAVRPHYEMREERSLPAGRVIRLEDWIYESETHAICICVFLHEERTKSGYQWETTTFAYRRRALRKADLAPMLERAGFTDVTFLPQSSPWSPYAVTASKNER